MNLRAVFPLGLLLIAACSQAEQAPSGAELVAEPECLDLTAPGAIASVSGVLTVQLLAGPPNYESIAAGDAEERAFILELDQRLCADDGTFITPDSTFDRVQLTSDDPRNLDLMRAATGRRVDVSGEAFGSHTGHHHAPLVMFVSEISVP